MSFYTKDSYEANKRYKAAHIKKCAIEMQKEEYARLKAYCIERGLPVATFIKACIRKEMESA